ncbi:hypothetical protein WCX18_04305 [Sulfurimonas sp. HSL1-2]|uniref:hypothetical protein n=1 Tax=Thiomicrolovo zhangzhouensis TaxID=3131933 RepID=UPI0031F93054
MSARITAQRRFGRSIPSIAGAGTLLFILLSVVLFQGCANVVRFEKPSLVAHAEKLDGSDDVLYYSIGIDFTETVAPDIAKVRLKFTPETASYALYELTPAVASRYLERYQPPPQWPEAWKQRAAKDDAYEGKGIYMKFAAGRLERLGLCSHCAGGRAAPIVGTADGGAFYALPLTERQMVELFGAPLKRMKVREVYY